MKKIAIVAIALSLLANSYAMYNQDVTVETTKEAVETPKGGFFAELSRMFGYEPTPAGVSSVSWDQVKNVAQQVIDGKLSLAEAKKQLSSDLHSHLEQYVAQQKGSQSVDLTDEQTTDMSSEAETTPALETPSY